MSESEYIDALVDRVNAAAGDLADAAAKIARDGGDADRALKFSQAVQTLGYVVERVPITEEEPE